MNYVIPDIHNDNRRFRNLLKRIEFSRDDHIYLLGDMFDRGSYDPDPVGVYFSILEIEGQCTIVSGNHDRWLAEYIRAYLGTKERKRKKLPSYYYNSFDLIRDRLPEVDMLNLADWLMRLPLQHEAEINGSRVLFAHAITSDPNALKDDIYYLMGDGTDDTFYVDGIEGYTSFCGHASSSFFARYGGSYLDEELKSIWRNDKGNVYMMDCGCGYADGQLACLCLDDMRRVYE